MTNRTRQIVSGTAAASLISALAGAPMAQAAKYWSPQGASTNFNADPTTAANSNYVTTNGGSTRSTIGPADAANFDTAGLNQPTLTADISLTRLEFSASYTLSSMAGTLTLTSNNTTSSGGFSMSVSSPTSGAVTISAPLALGASGSQVFYNSGGTGGQVLTLSGPISGGDSSANLILYANGGIVVSGDNSYASNTWIYGGNSVSVSSLGNAGANGNLGAGSVIGFGSGGSAGSLIYTGSGEQTSKALALNSTTGATTITQSGSGALVFTSTAAIAAPNAGNKTLILQGSTSGTGEIDGIVQNGAGVVSLNKAGSGTWTVTAANTYTGATTVAGGTLAFAIAGDGGSSSSLGAASNAASTLLLANGSTLSYIGAGGSTDRSFTLNATTANSGATLDASGSGAIAFTNTASPAFGTSNQSRTLTLAGTNTANNTLAAGIANNGTGAVAVLKNGVGTWALTGASTYTGGTTVNGGTLLVGGSGSATGTGAVNVTAGRFGGAGMIAGAIQIGDGSGTNDALLAPGNPGQVGTLGAAGVTFSSDGQYQVDLVGGVGATVSDKTQVNGTITLGAGVASLNAAFLSGTAASGEKYFILTNDGATPVDGYFAGLLDANGAISSDDPTVLTANGYALKISYTGDSSTAALTGGNDVVLYSVAVPEPATLTLLSLGGLALLRRTRRAGRGV